jgi:hypothetical protein
MEEYKYTCEPGHTEWSPMNSNLTMQGIKVKENRPIPEKTTNNMTNSHEDTLLLLDLMRQKRADEGQKKRVGLISWYHNLNQATNYKAIYKEDLLWL